MKTFKEITKELSKMSDKELKKQIDKENDNLVDHAKSLRKRAMKGKEYIDTFEEQTAEKYSCEKINGKWVQKYPDFRVPTRILDLLQK